MQSQDRYCGRYETEWDFERDVLIRNGVSEKAILMENHSGHTVENAFFSKETVDGLNLDIKAAIICCKAFHARRCLMTYGWAFPDTRFIICPVDTQGISRDNWYRTEYGREKVLSELAKCGSYFRDAVGLFSQAML
jgi:uncharacterized SAM-binding protein YcdF (DUF218 family)